MSPHAYQRKRRRRTSTAAHRRQHTQKYPERIIMWAHCEPCDKRRYTSKADARTALSRHGESRAMHVYECRHYPGHWHLGHLPYAVRRGEIDRHSYYAQEG